MKNVKNIMKNSVRPLVKLNVMKSAVKFLRDKPTEQERDADGNPLWMVTVKEEILNEEFGETEVVFSEYKSIVELDKGTHFARLKISNIGNASGNYVGVDSYFKIMGVIDEKKTVADIFSLSDQTLPSRRKAVTTKASSLAQ